MSNFAPPKKVLQQHAEPTKKTKKQKNKVSRKTEHKKLHHFITQGTKEWRRRRRGRKGRREKKVSKEEVVYYQLGVLVPKQTAKIIKVLIKRDGNKRQRSWCKTQRVDNL